MSLPEKLTLHANKAIQNTLNEGKSLETPEILLDLLDAPSLTSRAEELISMNLIDDATKRLHEQLKNLTAAPSEGEEREYGARVYADGLTIAQTACMTAMTIAKLVKVKIDGIKTLDKARRIG